MCLSIAIHRPEDVLSKGTYLGHEFVVVKNAIGFRCGYVKVEAGHPWHGKEYNEIDCDVHGGLTFAEHDVHCDAGGPDSGYWFGFDCGHSGDAKDPSIMKLEYREREERFNREFAARYPQFANVNSHDTIKDTAYVESNCRSLCEQAALAVK